MAVTNESKEYSNKHIKGYIEDLIEKRASAQWQLEEATERLKHWNEDKDTQERRIDEIDEALLLLGYQGEEEVE